MRKIVVIGGGAAGMFAAYQAAKNGADVIIYEKNEKLGKKLFITGKGRCNVTNGCDEIEDLFRNVVTNSRFLYSAFYTFNNHDMMHLLEEYGLSLKIERGMRVFPVSDKSSDVIRTLTNMLKEQNVKICLNTAVKSLLMDEQVIHGVLLDDGTTQKADAVILATGGVSYTSTGSTGDGHKMAAQAGHRVTELHPSLIPFTIQEEWCKELQGLSLKNIEFVMYQGKKVLYKEFGEMMFTHFGVTGPVVLSGSTCYAKYAKKGTVYAYIDLKPSLSFEQLDARILRDFDKNLNKQIRNSLSELLPSSLIPVMIKLSGIDPYTVVHNLTREQRHKLVDLIKKLPLTITGTRSINEAIITQGGVHVKEVNPSTMESKLIKGLYFAGEILDLDAVTGGYNLQIAWSTAYVAGLNSAEIINM